jgi:hypothetical protein
VGLGYFLQAVDAWVSRTAGNSASGKGSRRWQDSLIWLYSCRIAYVDAQQSLC